MAKVNKNNVQLFPITNISSPYRYTLLTEENTVNNVLAMYDVKVEVESGQQKNYDGFVVAYNATSDTISFVLGGYYCKIKGVTDYVGSDDNVVYVSMAMDTTSAIEGGTKSAVVDSVASAGKLDNLEIVSQYLKPAVGEMTYWLKLLEKKNATWTVPDVAKIRANAARIAGAIDCGSFSTVEEFAKRKTTFNDRAVNFK